MMTWPFTAYGSGIPAPNTLNVLARVSDFVNPYTSNVWTVSTNTTQNMHKRKLLTRFLVAMIGANRWLAQRDNALGAVASLASVLNITNSLAFCEYLGATNPDTGETSAAQNGDFSFKHQDVLNVIQTRSLSAGWAANMLRGFSFADAIVPRAGGVLDYSIRDAALLLLAHNATATAPNGHWCHGGIATSN